MFYTYLIVILVFVVVLRPISTLIHELGHGIPALLLTKGKVTLYIGSYGDPKDSIKINIGRLEVFFRKNPFHWKIGLCQMHDENISIKNQIFVTLMGPIMSLLLALLVTYNVFFANWNDAYVSVLFFFGISTYFDFFANIIPNKTPIELYNGTIIYNDGQAILDLLKFKRLPPEYEEAINLYDDQQFFKAGELFNELIALNHKQDYIYRLAISAYLNAHDYHKAKLINQEFEKKNNKANFDTHDYNNSGLVKSYLKDFSKSLKDYERSLELQPDNTLAINNRGYTYNLMEEYEKAIIDFDKAIALEPDHPYPYNNRGLAKIKLGRTDEGLKDIDKSMSLDKNNAYAYMNLGVYYYDTGNYKEALEKFNLALELDVNTYEIRDRIKETKEKITK
ncbi:tetratricopeptide repeat protein [Croceitalea sp. P059]|uniref:tetratricopeptide repeat protein n=1 Tax=Croceitalea sp. P059 TaxID=3075601 RepID=UPI002884EE7F|nr:tetratricopeptide repeat protein [Croceitalea sp. P059]MDT0539758.1 tetratricopeptide repeat protein [Croceitalea sp. P059]